MNTGLLGQICGACRLGINCGLKVPYWPYKMPEDGVASYFTTAHSPGKPCSIFIKIEDIICGRCKGKVSFDKDNCKMDISVSIMTKLRNKDIDTPLEFSVELYQSKQFKPTDEDQETVYVAHIRRIKGESLPFVKFLQSGPMAYFAFTGLPRWARQQQENTECEYESKNDYFEDDYDKILKLEKIDWSAHKNWQ